MNLLASIIIFTFAVRDIYPDPTDPKVAVFSSQTYLYWQFNKTYS